ncbi:MAG TPA: PQQ-binding-like beta-propeller repeat protein [Bacteroidales bacterium]|nr:PQQ-binding-like beta-propeller repeat protein [Bacteroidales bacterium]HQG62935.1 PQQ-binding-like beta-propeller repeat protein [Bacteroidales bacterium]HQK67468.1 PQQ-binding-like beta-propeller repeat protein [Bacteroidales bacterium]
MKRIIVIIASLIIIVAIGYAVFYIFSQGAPASPANPVRVKPVDLSGSENISEWREENRTGNSAETGLLKSWPDAGPELIWSNLDLPKGNSSVSFGNNTIYLTGNDNVNDILVALDEYGKIKWKTPYGRIWKGSHPESRCTPTVEEDMVYVSSGFGDLACINGISGQIIWSVKASEIYKGTYGSWGIAESLLIDGDKLYFTPGGPETTTIALDKNTGQLVWKTESLDVPASYSSPVLVDYSDYKLLINVTPRYVFGVDVSDGKILWKIDHLEALGSKEKGNDQILCVTPLFFNNEVYFTGGYNHGSVLLSLTENGRKASVKWTEKNLDVHHGGVVLVDGYIYGANWINNNTGNWCCLEASTGKKMYEETWKCKGSIISAEGLLYIYDERTGHAGLVRPDPEKFDLISSFRVREGSGPYWAHPVIHNGVLYLRHGEALMAYNIKV